MTLPNKEVRASLNQLLLGRFRGDSELASMHSPQLYRLLLANDFNGLEQLFSAFFASTPHDWSRKNPTAQYDGYYASVIYSHFVVLGLDLRVEDVTHPGRIDMTVLFNGHVYIFEFKVVELVSEGAALKQLQEKRYADKYRDRGEPVVLIGVEFSRETRGVVAFDTLLIDP